MTERTVVKFLNRKVVGKILTNKKTFRDIDISKIVTNGTEVRSDQFPKVQNEWSNVDSNRPKGKNLLYPRFSIHISGTFMVQLKKRKQKDLNSFQWHYPYEGASWFTCYWHKSWVWYLVRFNWYFSSYLAFCLFNVSLCIQSECGKMWTRKNFVFGHFSRSAGRIKDDSFKNLSYERIFSLHYAVHKPLFSRVVFIFVYRCLVTYISSVTLTLRCCGPICICGFAYPLRYFIFRIPSWESAWWGRVLIKAEGS